MCSPPGSVASISRVSSAVRNSQSRKSSSSRPFTVSSSVPGRIPSASAMLPGWMRATFTIDVTYQIHGRKAMGIKDLTAHQLNASTHSVQFSSFAVGPLGLFRYRLENRRRRPPSLPRDPADVLVLRLRPLSAAWQLHGLHRDLMTKHCDGAFRS